MTSNAGTLGNDETTKHKPMCQRGRRHKWRQRQPSQSKHSRIKERHEGSYSPKEPWTENQPTPLHIAFKMLKLAHKQYEKLQE